MSNIQQASEQNRVKAERVPNTHLKSQQLKKNWTQVYVATLIGSSDVEVSHSTRPRRIRSWIDSNGPRCCSKPSQ